MTDQSCPYCQQDTAGNHQDHCPLRQTLFDRYEDAQRILPLGWRCPSCGQVYAPWVAQCDYCVPRLRTSSSTRLHIRHTEGKTQG